VRFHIDIIPCLPDFSILADTFKFQSLPVRFHIDIIPSLPDFSILASPFNPYRCVFISISFPPCPIFNPCQLSILFFPCATFQSSPVCFHIHIILSQPDFSILARSLFHSFPALFLIRYWANFHSISFSPRGIFQSSPARFFILGAPTLLFRSIPSAPPMP
jgi:hypothetical protein